MAFSMAATSRSFFDRPKVQRTVDKKKRSALSKFGAFVRRRAKSSIRKRKKSADPGMPPSSHIGTLKNLLFFAYDERTKSVVIGPAPIGAKAIVPGALERGGKSVIVRRIKSAKGGERLRVLKPIHVRKHPYMAPALAAERPKFAGLFRG
jgi:hypothetical protein